LNEIKKSKYRRVPFPLEVKRDFSFLFFSRKKVLFEKPNTTSSSPLDKCNMNQHYPGYSIVLPTATWQLALVLGNQSLSEMVGLT
jgi:hypothetical protein